MATKNEMMEGIRQRHALVEQSADKIATASEMSYLSHLDRGDLLNEIERLRAADRWVPITESLPPSGHKVLGYWKNELGKSRRTCVEYIAPRTLDAESICWDDTPDDWFECDESGTCWAPSGWYERVEGADEYPYTVIPVTHWRHLPEMPS